MIPLGRLVWVAWGGLGSYFMLAKILPLLMMVWASLLPYFQPFSIKALSFLSFKNFEAIDWTLVGRGTLNTVILMLVVPTVAIIFGLTISWIVTRTKTKGRFIFDWIAFLPHAVPNLIFALAAILFALYVLPKSVPFYGTIFILMAIYILTRISLTTRVLNGSLLQIHKELEEAAYVSGMSTIPTMWKIVFPLIMPAVVNLWIWNALLTYRELTMAAFLVTQENITLPVVIWSLWNSGTTGEAAAVSLFFVATLVPLIAAYWGLRGRTEL
jgi:iron(III) transport system permease protein